MSLLWQRCYTAHLSFSFWQAQSWFCVGSHFVGWQRGGANGGRRADVDKSTRWPHDLFIAHNYAFIYRLCVFDDFHFRAPAPY